MTAAQSALAWLTGLLFVLTGALGVVQAWHGDWPIFPTILGGLATIGYFLLVYMILADRGSPPTPE